MNSFAELAGARRTFLLRAGFQVSKKAMARFNEEVPDSDKVYYQSWAAHVRRDYPNTLWKALASILHITDGKNDGLVGVESAKWGNFRGIIGSESATTISHADMVGLTQFSGHHGFKAKEFIAGIVHELKEMGY